MIAVSGLSVRQGTFALEGVSLTVPAGGYALLVGPSGCGKTTLLECVAGLRAPLAGTITLNGRDVTRLPPEARNVGYAPQEAAVFTHLSVRENLGFALAVRGWKAAAVRERVNELAGRLGLVPLLERRADGLSGGEGQRVAVGRALAARPPVLLLDEPLSAVDAATRERVLAALREANAAGATVLHVTHDAGEAERLGAEVVELASGAASGPG